MSERHIIHGTATVGPISIKLFAPWDDPDREWPWAIGALCRIRFTIGELTTSKRMTSKFSWWEHGGVRPRSHRPSDAEITETIETVLRNLRTDIARHGFDPGVLTATEIDVSAGEVES